MSSGRRYDRRGPSLTQRADRFLGWIVQKIIGVFGLVIMFVLCLFLFAIFLVFIGDRLH